MSSNPEYKRDPEWVTKTHLLQYLRCPYFFWLVDSGQVAEVDVLTPEQMIRTEQGIQVHDQITNSAIPLVIEPFELPEIMIEKSITILGVPTYDNQELKIRGRPDGIMTGKGALFPLEIKTRKDRKATDKLELAFYWLLYEPLRTRRPQPVGHLWLRSPVGVKRNIEIVITNQMLDEVHGLIAEVRQTRKDGAEPRYHNCPYCNGANREVSLQISQQRKDISLIRGVGPVTLRQLQLAGIRNYDELETTNEFDLIEKIRAKGGRVSLEQIRKWKQHIKSYQENKPIVFGQLPVIGDSFIILDLEYVQHVQIWLIGLAIVRNKRSQLKLLWADDEKAELLNLRILTQIIDQNHDLKVVTWNGKAADIPQIESAKFRHPDLKSKLSTIKKVHFDLFWHVKQNLSLPIPELGLHQVAQHFQLPQSSDVKNGLHACALFQEYKEMRNSPKKRELKRKLLEYSRLDLEALLGIIDRVRLFSASASNDKETERDN